MKIFKYIFAGWILSNSLVLGDPTAINSFVDKYYHPGFDTDGTGYVIVSQRFIKEVPLEEQGEVLAQILDRASAAKKPSYRLIGNIIGFVGWRSKSEGKIIWNEHLKQAVYAQAKSPDSDVRVQFIHLLFNTQGDKARDMILSFLNDPDEHVRYTVLNGITSWPGSEQIYLKYIQDHQNDQNYAQSVSYAKANLDILHKVQKD